MRTSWSHNHTPTTAAVALVLASALTLTACTTAAAPEESSPATTAVPAEPTPEPTPEPSPEPTPDPTPDGPPVFDAGTATPDESKTVTGTGPASITFSIEPMAPVYQFTCADCTGEVNVTLADPAVPMWHTTGPVDGTWMSSPLGPIAKPNTISVDANGTWTLTITNMFMLPTTSGPQSGRGAAVLRFDQAATQLDYTFTPYGAADIAGLYAYDDRGRAMGEEIFRDASGTLDVTLPAYVFIRADGDWTITPR